MHQEKKISMELPELRVRKRSLTLTKMTFSSLSVWALPEPKTKIKDHFSKQKHIPIRHVTFFALKEVAEILKYNCRNTEVLLHKSLNSVGEPI